AGGQRLAEHRRLGAHELEHLGDRGGAGRDGGPHRPAVAQPARDRAGVDALQADHAAGGQPVGEALAAVRRRVAALADDHRTGGRRGRLGRVGLDAVVPDHRLGEGDELAREGRVGDDLLVARHRCREDHLADGDAVAAVRTATVDGAVLEDEERAHATASIRRWATRPPEIVSRQTPRSDRPAKAQLRDREAYGGSITREAPRSHTAMSATRPLASPGAGSPKASAGPDDIRSMTVCSGSMPGSTRWV